MKNLLIIIVLSLSLTWCLPAHAGSTPPNCPPNGVNALQYTTSNNAFACNAVGLGTTGVLAIPNGGTAATTAQGALNNLNAQATGSAAYQISPCQGFSDEQKFSAGQQAAVTLNLGAMTYPSGCVFDNQWKFAQTGRNVNIFQFGGSGNEKNTAQGGFVGPGTIAFYYYIPGILANAAGQTVIDVNGDSEVTFNGTMAFPQNSASTDPFMGISFLNNSSGAGGCCNQDTVNAINATFGGGNTIMGFPLDNDLNPIQNGGVRSGTLTLGGSGYVNGTYYNVPLTGGSGTGMKMAKIVVSGGIVTSVGLASADGDPNNNRVTPGGSYVVNDVLGVSNANLGGSGSGFQYTVNTLYSRITGSGSLPNMLPHFMNSFFSDYNGAALMSNFSDAQIIGNTFTGSQAIQAFFGGGANQIAENKFEDDTNAVDLGGVNGNGFTEKDIVNSNVFTTNSFGGGFDMRIGRGYGFVVNGNEIDSNANKSVNTSTSAATASFIIGGNGNMALANVNGNVWTSQPATIGKLYCIDIPSGFVTDYINMSGNVCGGGGPIDGTGHVTNTTIIANVHYGQVPAHFVEDFVGPFGIHREQGRSWVIDNGSASPRADFDIGSMASAYVPKLVAPIGSTQVNIASNANASTPTGTAAYYKLDDASGTTAVDAVSAANGTWNGTLGSQWGTGIINGDGVFNGTDNYISTTYAGVTGTGARSYSMWVKTTSQAPNTGQNASSIVFYGSVGSGTQFELNTNDKYGGGTNFPGLTFDPGGGAITYSASSLFDGNWHHVVITQPASPTILTTKIYLDGVLLTTVSHSSNTGQSLNTGSTNPINIGGYSDGLNFNGQIDEFAAFPSQLTSGQILFLYNSGLANQYPYSAENQASNIINVTDAGSNAVMSLSGTGNLGIGTSAASVPLQVGSSVSVGTQLILQNSSGACAHNPGASSETVTCSSDAALKADIVDSPSSLDWLSDIKIRDFTVKATGERMQGVVAQEMLPTHSDMVHIAPNGLYAVDQPNPWILVKALQEEQNEINLILGILAGAPVLGAGAVIARRKLSNGKPETPTDITSS